MPKKRSKVLTLFYMLVIFYAVFYFFFLNGYLESVEKDKLTLTKEAMVKFENDVANGKDVTLNDYLSLDKKDYSTNVSKVGNTLGRGVEYLMKDGIKILTDTLKKLFT